MYNSNMAEKENPVSKFELSECQHFVQVVWQVLLLLTEGEKRLYGLVA